MIEKRRKNEDFQKQNVMALIPYQNLNKKDEFRISTEIILINSQQSSFTCICNLL
jgi:hypothetical protein